MIFRLGFIKVIVLLILIATIPVSLYSQELSNKEVREKMSEAQELFDERDINGSLKVLTEILDSNPSRRDQVVDLVDKITEVRNEYNEIFRDVIDAIYVDKDPKRALEGIEKMGQLDSKPVIEVEDSIRKIRIATELVYNEIALYEIMDNAKIQLNIKEYEEALNLYSEAFDFGKVTYNESIIPDLQKDDIFRTINEVHSDSLTSLLESGINLQTDILSLRSSINTTLSSGLDDEINNLISQFNDFSEDRALFLNKISIIDNNRNLIVNYIEDNNTTAPEIFYLNFSQYLFYGRNDRVFDYLGNPEDEQYNEYEGIIAALDLFWEEQFVTISSLIDQQRNNSYQLAINSYNNGNFDSAETFFGNTLNYSRLSIGLYEALTNRVSMGDDFSLDFYSSDLIQKYHGNLVDSRIHARVTDSYSKLITLKRKFENYSLSDDQSIEDLYALRNQIIADLPTIETEQALWNTIDGSINWLDSYNSSPQNADDVTILVKSDMSNLKIEMEDINLAILTRLTDQEYERITGSFQEYNTVYLDSKKLVDGISDEQVIAYTGDDNLLSSYPDRALPDLEKLLIDIDALYESTEDIINTFTSGDISGPAIDDFVSKTSLLLPQIDDLYNKADDLEIVVRDNIFRAEGFVNQGDKQLQQARQTIGNPRANLISFNRARQTIISAEEAFDQSYSFQEDLDLRIRVQDDVDKLLEDLQKASFNLAAADVANLYEQAVSAYEDRSYGESRVLLDQANELWSSISEETNPQIERLLVLVELALEISGGRSISKYEPLYDEMIQYLNVANQYYIDGKKLFESGDETEGESLFEEAIVNLKNVESLFGENENAFLIRLKIDQVIDKDEFNEKFQNLIDDAWEKVNNSAKDSQYDGYNELKSFSVLDQNFPGLKQRIFNAEIIIGIREVPRDPRLIARSKKLYDEALAIVESGNRARWIIAANKLIEAKEDNPDNIDADILLRRIQINQDTPTSGPVPANVQARFDAIQLLIEQGNNFKAIFELNELGKEIPSSKDYPKYDELAEAARS